MSDEKNNNENLNNDMNNIEEEKKTDDKSNVTEDKESLDYRDKLLRLSAEFDNYKKRKSEEYLRLYNTATTDLVKKLLSVIDDMDRLEKNYTPDMKLDDIVKGTDMIHSNFKSVLKNEGLIEIETEGKSFDPDFHEAVMMREVDGKKAGEIIDEVEKGYMFKDKVIRHSKVIVAK